MPSARPRSPFGGYLTWILVLIAIAVLIGAATCFWIVAPAVVPSHFDASGRPDDWSSKIEFLAVLVPMGVGLPLLLSIRWIWERVPPVFLNVPHKDYWLDRGERGYLYDCLMEFLRIVAAAMALLFAAILMGSLQQALGASETLGSTLWPLAIFLVITGIAVWHLYRRLTPAA